jgi:hypothetical protein
MVWIYWRVQGSRRAAWSVRGLQGVCHSKSSWKVHCLLSRLSIAGSSGRAVRRHCMTGTLVWRASAKLSGSSGVLGCGCLVAAVGGAAVVLPAACSSGKSSSSNRDSRAGQGSSSVACPDSAAAAAAATAGGCGEPVAAVLQPPWYSSSRWSGSSLAKSRGIQGAVFGCRTARSNSYGLQLGAAPPCALRCMALTHMCVCRSYCRCCCCGVCPSGALLLRWRVMCWARSSRATSSRSWVARTSRCGTRKLGTHAGIVVCLVIVMGL